MYMPISVCKGDRCGVRQGGKNTDIHNKNKENSLYNIALNVEVMEKIIIRNSIFILDNWHS